MKFIIALGAAALALSAGASGAAPHAHAAGPAPSCFRSNDIRSHVFDDADTMYMRVGIKDIYRVQTSGRCLAAHMRDDPLIIDPGPPNGLICRPVDFSLKIGHQGDVSFPTPCIVKSIDKLTPAEAAALPPKLRP